MRELRLRAPAKINPYLRILGRRPDGYHAIETVMLAIDWADELVIRSTPDGEGRTVLRCSDPSLPTDADNLVVRAVDRVRTATGRRDDVEIDLTKHVPHGGGLGGGSSDAAATMAGLNALWELGESATTLGHWGADLGSDISFFFFGGLAVCRGRGEIIEPIDEPDTGFARLHPVIYFAGDHVPTGGVYQALQADPITAEDAAAQAETTADLCRRVAGTGPQMQIYRNDLEAPARAVSATLGATFARTDAALPGHRLLTGSGGAIVFYAATEAEQQTTADALNRMHANGARAVKPILVNGPAARDPFALFRTN